ncbi:patatin-like phospholipase family protein [Paralimibaculum aggregatum]|uniref:Patatin-like phospholipase family protein n=1 Tax=Paralimibaculum aggregatum TaxID=3036245 RepID=A0ABQ6LK30_9RHOB|nr:patatin-like phospholipase family protein [Limibaculum sp. NKW23]GMG83611.1 patatin-like phospholipase family protein [Limibaculum sp. NKW23]
MRISRNNRAATGVPRRGIWQTLTLDLKTVLACLALPLLLGACGAGVIRTPVPNDLVESVKPFGKPGMREWGDTLSQADIEEIIAARVPVMKRLYAPEIAAGRIPVQHFLALSGGGQWGAFGAGILGAWSESGTRPEFTGVSGVSTGAIIAPFAFLGADYDATLLEIYSTYKTAQLVESTLISGLLSGTALADTTPLARVIAKYVTPELLEKIAAEHRKGRLLFIGTTNLDAGRPMIWNIGAIANSGEPGALELVRKLIRASSAIPVAFPPMFVEVQGPDGKSYDEMHVDGGASSQVTFVSPDLPIAEATRRVLGTNLDRRLWVIVNNDLEPPHQIVKPRIADIGGAAVSSLIRGSGTGDVYRLFAIAERDEIAFNVTWIPSDIPCPAPTEDFDTVFMTCLYQAGGDLFRKGNLWRNTPPFFARPEDLPAILPEKG